jgi:hypothetical protein
VCTFDFDDAVTGFVLQDRSYISPYIGAETESLCEMSYRGISETTDHATLWRSWTRSIRTPVSDPQIAENLCLITITRSFQSLPSAATGQNCQITLTHRGTALQPRELLAAIRCSRRSM